MKKLIRNAIINELKARNMTIYAFNKELKSKNIAIAEPTIYSIVKGANFNIETADIILKVLDIKFRQCNE